ncbi:MAG: hypothetical protein AAF770_01090 [Bacteroidota bacterium]
MLYKFLVRDGLNGHVTRLSENIRQAIDRVADIPLVEVGVASYS